MSESIGSREVPRYGVVAVVTIVLVLLVAAIWWRTGTHTRDQAYSAATSAHETDPRFQKEMESQRPKAGEPAAGSVAAREATEEFQRQQQQPDRR